MLINKPAGHKSCRDYAKRIYLNRRQFIMSSSAIALSAGAAATGLDWFQFPTKLAPREIGEREKEFVQQCGKTEFLQRYYLL